MDVLTRFVENRDSVMHAEEEQYRAAMAALTHSEHEAQLIERKYAAEVMCWRDEHAAVQSASDALRAKVVWAENTLVLAKALLCEEQEQNAQMETKLDKSLAKKKAAVKKLHSKNTRIHSEFSTLYAANIKQQEVYKAIQAKQTNDHKEISVLQSENYALWIKNMRLGREYPVSAWNVPTANRNVS